MVIGVYLAAMGMGSYASRYVVSGIVSRFIDIELMIAVVGGFSAALMFLVLRVDAARASASCSTASWCWSGFLVGLEIPLVMRILKERLGFRDLVAQVLTFDYLGALAVSIAFPLLLAPRLGLIRTGLPLRAPQRRGGPVGRVAVPGAASPAGGGGRSAAPP